MRPFGSDVGDLEVDFTAESPFLVTDLLRRCASLTDDDAWSLPVSARIEALVGLAILSGSRPLAVGLRCPRVECREALEIEIEAGELRGACADRERDSVNVRVGESWMQLRRPTGRDQREWLGTYWSDLEAARSGILASLLTAPPGASLGATANEPANTPLSVSANAQPSVPVSTPLDARAVATLETALANIDPLVDFTLQVACPACGQTAEHTLEVEQHALATLRRIQERLFEGVARLATRFHWTEAEIFAVPLWRRERYLALTESLQ